jgi:hypothetical protein
VADVPAAGPRRRRTPWVALTFRIIVIGLAALAAGWLIFGPQLTGIIGSFRAVAIGVRNATPQAILVTTVAPGGQRAFYTVGPSETRLIPDDPHDVVSVLDATCHVRDSHGRGSVQATEFLLADVTPSSVTWVERPMPAAIQPAATGQACPVQ